MPVIDRETYRVTLLDHWERDPRALARPAVGSALFHLVVLLALLTISRDRPEAPPERVSARLLTHLVDPPTRLTQKAPNRSPVPREISVAPRIEAPQPKQPPKSFRSPPRAPQPITRRPPQTPQEPPRIKPASNAPPVSIANNIPPPPPPVQRTEPPRIALENVPPAPKLGQGTGALKVPSASVDEAVRNLSGTPSQRSIQDPNAGPAARNQTTIEPEIISDTNGVDMKPYVLRVLANVRRNWLAVYPESARLGLRGQVVVQFEISSNGVIAKTIFVEQSRAVALDRAAISALSMSDPLPPPPDGLNGKRVILQFTFSYNMPKQ